MKAGRETRYVLLPFLFGRERAKENCPEFPPASNEPHEAGRETHDLG